MRKPIEQLVEQALGSTEQMSRAEAPPFLYGRIMERMKQHIPEPVFYTGKMVFRFAAVMAVVIALNVLTYVRTAKPGHKSPSEQELLHGFAKEYFETDHLYQY